ncbi:senescence-associated protein AAF, chloroplastic isoform X2 [Cicer arietinum]|uniref:Senescence-associated protein AAF, chlorolplastic n=1 Tax=Cicer arietinum TaxID=3827 RepID=A0A1S3DYG9_CICAR|nr:senescence-associated protein AAF, chlorolplastic [Cicer arietinum]XP_012568500.1 senescence-associated protein AAF, chlorolplastic [Cicer arietinum]
MALTANKVSNGPILTNRSTISRSHGEHYFSSSTRINRIQLLRVKLEHGHVNNGFVFNERSSLFNESFWFVNGKPVSLISKTSLVSCKSTGANNTEEKERVTAYDDVSDLTRRHAEDQKNDQARSVRGLAEAYRFVCNDAKFLSRGIMRMDARARRDVAFLGTEFLKLDARARKDTEKIDRGVKEKAKRLNRIATILKDIAQSRLKSAADEHWSDGALEADLRLADFRAKQRAMEDALMALELIKNIHNLMVSKMYHFPISRDKGSLSENNARRRIMLEKNGKTTNSFPGDVTTERINALQEAYWSMASALSEADGIDYTDPEELELLITTLIDLDAMDGKQSVSLLAECSSSPDVSTRRALAKALAAAPSMWTLGNAGMGALQRLAEDSNPAIAAAASKAIYELKKQWEIEEGDNWRFMMDESTKEENES